MEETASRSKRLSRPKHVRVLDGQDLAKAMLAATAWLEENRDRINTLNVFPVPDGDTGSNMTATMKSAMRNIASSDEKSASVVANKIAHDALLGARGNSGVILSQTLRGLAEGLKDKQTFTVQDLAVAFEQSAQLAYRAVIKPVEGTILTVVREVAEAAKKGAENNDDLVSLMTGIVIAARKAVASTPDLLPTLKQAGVVDAGGQGFCTILEGVLRYIRGDHSTLPQLTLEQTKAEEAEKSHLKKGRVTVEEDFGYEVVFLLHGEHLDVAGIRQTIIDMGGVSTVVAGDETMLKVHTHTATPGKILDYGVSLGSLLDINIENLQEQSLTYAAASAAEHADDKFQAEMSSTVEETEASTPSISTVAVVSGTGFEQVFKGLGVSAIICGGQTMNPSIEELLDAVEKAPSRQVIILPNNGNVILSAQQVVGLTSKEVYVIPCKTLPQGIAAMISINYEADFATNCEVMSQATTAIQTAEITTAVRSVQLGGLHVREGDFIGVINGNLAVAGQSIDNVMNDTLRRLNVENYEILTLYYGQGITEAQAEETARCLKEQYSQLEIEVINGGQPYYAYILSAE